MSSNPVFMSILSDEHLSLLTPASTDEQGLGFTILWDKQINRRLRENKIQSNPALAQQYIAEDTKKRLEQELMHAILS